MRDHECGGGRREMGRMGRLAMAMMRGAGGHDGPGRHFGGGRGWDGGRGGEGPDGGFADRRGPHGPGRRGFGRGGRGRMFGGGELRLVLLRLIADQGRHGYELIKAIEELTGGEYAPSPGVVYPTLSLLVDEARIAESVGEGAREGGRKAFAVTKAGTVELTERADEADALLARLKALAARPREDSPPVRRAIANLHTALRQRMDQAIDIETAHSIADILDEAARKVERL